MILASSLLPVKMNKPGNDINVSLPQFLMYPVEKWGNPAAHETFEDIFSSSLRFSDIFGRGDESNAAACWIDPSERNLTKVDPSLTNEDIRFHEWSNNAQYNLV